MDLYLSELLKFQKEPPKKCIEKRKKKSFAAWVHFRKHTTTDASLKKHQGSWKPSSEFLIQFWKQDLRWSAHAWFFQALESWSLCPRAKVLWVPIRAEYRSSCCCYCCPVASQYWLHPLPAKSRKRHRRRFVIPVFRRRLDAMIPFIICGLCPSFASAWCLRRPNWMNESITHICTCTKRIEYIHPITYWALFCLNGDCNVN